jgi:hypothetical protein
MCLLSATLAIRDMNTLLFTTTLLIPFYDIGKEVGVRIYEHILIPFVMGNV